MERKRHWFSLGIVFIVMALQAHAAEYFVAVDGNDSNSGSQERPFFTIQKATDLMKPGDTCYIRGGIYRQVVRLKRSGTQGKPICFVAWPGEVVVLSGTEPIHAQWSRHRGRIYKTTVSDVDALDTRLGRIVRFDRPMLPTEPAESMFRSE